MVFSLFSFEVFGYFTCIGLLCSREQLNFETGMPWNKFLNEARRQEELATNTRLGHREQIYHTILKYNTSAVWAPEVNSLCFIRLWQSFLICMPFFTSNHTFMLCPDEESLRLGILTSGREFFLFDIGQGSYSEKKIQIKRLGFFSLIMSH